MVTFTLEGFRVVLLTRVFEFYVGELIDSMAGTYTKLYGGG